MNTMRIARNNIFTNENENNVKKYREARREMKKRAEEAKDVTSK